MPRVQLPAVVPNRISIEQTKGVAFIELNASGEMGIVTCSPLSPLI